MVPRAKISFLILAASVAIAATAPAAIIYNNSNITSGIGNGYNGANTSGIGATDTNGYNDNSIFNGMNLNSRNQLAEDFSLSSASLVTSVVFDEYATSSTYPSPPVSPFTSGLVNIWSAQPGTPGAVVLFSSTTLAAASWTGVYRAPYTNLLDTQRPVFTLTFSFPSVALPAGSYWAAFAVTGVNSPGSPLSVFVPPVLNTDGTQPIGNGIVSMDNGATWAATANAGTGQPPRFPLLVNGSAVPEPTTLAMIMCAGLAGLVALRRRRAA